MKRCWPFRTRPAPSMPPSTTASVFSASPAPGRTPTAPSKGGQSVQVIPVSGGTARLVLSILAWGHVLVVCSDDVGDHIQNNSVYEDVFQ